MTLSGFLIRPAQQGDGQALYDVTHLSILASGQAFYSSEQLAGWMGARTAATYEAIIAKGNVMVAERNGQLVAFVDTEGGEVTRLFLLPEATGSGLGKHLLELGIERVKREYKEDIRVEATLNAESFYAHHGFKAVERGFFSHGVGGEPIAIVHMVLEA